MIEANEHIVARAHDAAPEADRLEVGGNFIEQRNVAPAAEAVGLDVAQHVFAADKHPAMRALDDLAYEGRGYVGLGPGVAIVDDDAVERAEPHAAVGGLHGAPDLIVAFIFLRGEAGEEGTSFLGERLRAKRGENDKDRQQP